MAGRDHQAARLGGQKAMRLITGNRRHDRQQLLEALNEAGIGMAELVQNIKLWVSDTGNAAAAAVARQDLIKLMGIYAPEQKEEVNKFGEMPQDELVALMLERLSEAGMIGADEAGKYRLAMKDHVRVGGMLIRRDELPPPRSDDDDITDADDDE